MEREGVTGGREGGDGRLGGGRDGQGREGEKYRVDEMGVGGREGLRVEIDKEGERNRREGGRVRGESKEGRRERR